MLASCSPSPWRPSRTKGVVLQQDGVREDRRRNWVSERMELKRGYKRWMPAPGCFLGTEKGLGPEP